MSTTDINFMEKLSELKKEKDVLYTLKIAIEQEKYDLKHLSSTTKRKREEILALLSKYDISVRVDDKNSLSVSENPEETKELLAKINETLKKLEQEVKSLRKSMFQLLDQVLIIPSWKNLLQTEFNGFYNNQAVEKIMMNPIIFLSDVALTSIESTIREPFILIFGAGLYWVKFSLGRSTLITDSREINALLLPLDLYEKAIDDSTSMFVGTRDALDTNVPATIKMTENFISIPFNIATAPQRTQMRLRGIIMRNVFHPFRELVDSFYQHCKNQTNYAYEEGLKILSAGLSTQKPLYFNEILTERPLSSAYMRLTAGLKNIQAKAKKIIGDFDIDQESLNEFVRKARILADCFSEVGFEILTNWDPERPLF